MEDKRKTTLVQNIMDDRSYVLCLPARMAVVAAHEFFDRHDFQTNYREPLKHSDFSEHKRGFSCGDWIAFKEVDDDNINEGTQ